jgi:hypothetical protein
MKNSPDIFKQGSLSKRLRRCFFVALSCFLACSASLANPKTSQKLVYWNLERLQFAKERINAKDPLYVNAYDAIIARADEELEKEIDPVTNKTTLPASGDIHDYHTLSSYYWPDPGKEDGLPWMYKDGEINPINYGPATDWERLKTMFSSLRTLNLAFFFSEDKKYIRKAGMIVHAWFVDEKTKVNPNVDFGKAIPGKVSGTNFAIIDWTGIGSVITTIQILDECRLWRSRNRAVMEKWLRTYYKWLTESEFGILESTRDNNHATNYDYQVIGLMIYLGKRGEAEAKIEEVKQTRIATQIDPVGSQPRELARTKSVNYTVNNLWALARITDLGRRFTRVDLWDDQNENGAGIKQAYDFVIPYLEGKETWSWRQITRGGAEESLETFALPMFRRTELMLGENILPAGLNGDDQLRPQDVLIYAPPATENNAGALQLFSK